MAPKVKPRKLPPMPSSGTYAEKVAARMRGVFGEDKVMLANSEHIRGQLQGVIPSPLEVVNQELFGCGGAPVGRIGELFAEEGIGKSSFLLGWLAECQKVGGLAMLCETENQLDVELRAPAFGLDLSQLLWWEPDCMEDVLEQFEAIAMSRAEEDPATRPPAMFGWDTLAATPTKKEISEGLRGRAAVAERARMMSHALRLIPRYAERGGIAVVIVNQTRANVGVTFGSNVITPGGNAVKFHASWRMRLMGGTAVKAGEMHIGKDPIFSMIKNKFGPPFRKARGRLLFDCGWDDQWTTCNYGKDMGFIGKATRASWKNATEVAECAGWDDAYERYKVCLEEETAAKVSAKKKKKAAESTKK